MTSAFRAAQRAPLLQVTKSAVATAIAWVFAGWLIQGPPPVFAAIAALLVVQPSLNQSFAKAIERSVGVIAGVAVASLLGVLLGESAWVVVIAIVAALLVAWALKMTAGTANQVAISAVLVLALGATTPGYAVDRVLETVIGAVIGVIVNVVLVPPVAVAPAHEKIDALADELAASLDRLGDALAEPRSRTQLEELLLKARLMRPMLATADQAIDDAQDSLALNPRGRRHRDELRDLRALLDRFRPVVTQVIGMTRAVYDHYDPAIADEPVLPAIGEQLHRAAHDVRLRMRRAAAPRTQAPPRGDAGASAPPTTTMPALTSPLLVQTPSADHWILIGSLLEDLRRIHEALGDTA
ncbi:aromatic acid exporter family protein [Microbacterium sp. NPDC078428]|uniref:aromatic acid exporter family protein n=1 Tax=Microbacterium sp. NPDC078428 TaxID=3364190 RepID=UPI0037CCB761